MEISSSWVGLKSRPHRVEVTSRMAMNYAASIGDNNPWYFADDRPGGIVAPPMIAVALTWPLSSRFQEYWDAPGYPVEVLATQVHYSEVLHFERPIAVDETLEIQGVLVAMESHRAGVHIVMRYDARDRKDGLVFTETIGGMLRGVTLKDGDRRLEGTPEVALAPEDSESAWEVPIHIGPLAAHHYDGCADIHFAIHTSPAFAKAVGLPGIIYHGTATLAHAVKTVCDRLGGGDPRRIAGIACNFTGMVPLDSTIRVVALKERAQAGHTSVSFHVLNQDGVKAVRNGIVTLRGSVG